MAFILSPVSYESGKIIYCLVRNASGQFLNNTAFDWAALTAETWSDFAHQAFESPESCGMYSAEIDDANFSETESGESHSVFYYEMSGESPSPQDICAYADYGRCRTPDGELDLPSLRESIEAVRAKTDAIPALLSLRAPNLSSSCYELAQYTTPTLTFTVTDILGAPVDLTGRTVSLRVQYGWGGRALFAKEDEDFDKSKAAQGQLSVTLERDDTAWTGRVRSDAPFQGELFDTTDGGQAELGRFVILLRPSHASPD
ncbi:MAG TPA: hypothetical protein PL033_12280 [Candidatus Brocadiia bacterium]|nr:hypothetical protein [Candidatus Brocadiia bacterium]